jgi:hypothetical protein
MFPVLPILSGLIAALVFELVSHGVYGTEDIMSHTWIDMVFWGLIGAGVLVSLVNVFWGCLPCRLSRLAHVKGLQDHLCRKVACS